MEKFGWEGNLKGHLAQPTPLDLPLNSAQFSLDSPWLCQEHQKQGPCSSKVSQIGWDRAGLETLLIPPPSSPSRLHFPPCDQSTFGFSFVFPAVSKPSPCTLAGITSVSPSSPCAQLHLLHTSLLKASQAHLTSLCSSSCTQVMAAPRPVLETNLSLVGGSRNNPINVNSQ